MNRRPPGWTATQLQALNDLAEAVDAWQLLGQVIDKTGDTSAKATRLRADLQAHARDAWTRLKAATPVAP